MKENSSQNKALLQFAELMISKIENVSKDWEKPWFSPKGLGLPQNIDGREYKGSNLMLLYLVTEMKDYSIPVFMTYNQAADAGIHVLKGAKSFPVIYWNFVVKDHEGNRISYEEYKLLDDTDKENYKVTPYMKTYPVFNVDQTNMKEALPEKWESLMTKFKVPDLKDENGMFRQPMIDALVQEQKWVCPINVSLSNSAYYKPGKNCHINVPMKGQFIDGQSWYSTLLHEMAHSTGEENLLNRTGGKKFGDKDYAKEELVAELTAATCGQTLGISSTIREENAQYLKSWLNALKENPQYINTLLSDVAKASGIINSKVNAMETSLSAEDKLQLSSVLGNKHSDCSNNNIIVECNGKSLSIDLSKKTAFLSVNGNSQDISKSFFELYKKETIQCVNEKKLSSLLKWGNSTFGKTKASLVKTPTGYSLNLSDSKNLTKNNDKEKTL